MHRLYQKNELSFALCWIAVYVAGTSLADSVVLGAEKAVTLLFHLALCAVAFWWLRRHGLNEKYGLCRPTVPPRKCLYYVPLLVPLTCNFWFGTAMNMPPVETALYIGSMLCVGFLEELIFRGFLYRAMEKDSVRWAVIVSSLTFGVGHIVNLFNGSGAQLVSNLCQVVYAAALGFAFVLLFSRGGSLWPCIIVHSLVNAFSAFANQSAMTPARDLAVAAALTIASAGYAIVLDRLLPGGSAKEKY